MLTIGRIAEQLGEPPWRVAYAARKAGLQPCGRAGRYFLYREADIAAIGAALQGIGRVVRPVPQTAEVRG